MGCHFFLQGIFLTQGLNLVPWPGIELCLLHWEWGVLATGPPGKSLSLFCLFPYHPFLLQLKKMFLYLFICAIVSQEMCTQVVQFGLCYNSFMKSTIFTKHSQGPRAISHWVLPISWPCPLSASVSQSLPCFKLPLHPSPSPTVSLPWSQNWPPWLLAGPLNPHCQSWLTCKADDIGLLVKPSGAPHDFQGKV